MKLQQLHYLVEVAKQGLNVSEAAEKLHTSQPGISKQIRLLEDELGIQVFIRNGKRVVAVSEPGKEVLRISERILREAQNLKRVGDEFSKEAEGALAIATEGIALYKELAMLPCYEWNRSIVAPVGHPLLALGRPLTLEDIASYPIITYDFAFAGRSRINQAFTDAGKTPNVVLTAIDTDVIKTYVKLGLGLCS